MKDNYVIKWLKTYFQGSKINEKDIKPLLHFSLLWNLFEHTYFTDSIHLKEENLNYPE